MRIGVTGSRNGINDAIIEFALNTEPIDAILINGMAPGVDTQCRTWWLNHGGLVEDYPADWDKYGRSAGPRRNQQMVDSGLDLLLVFPGGRGTLNMKTKALAAGIKLRIVERL